jgi:hypothetical protein
MISTIPDFATAVERFRALITQVGHPASELIWVFREDVSTYRRRVLVKVPIPDNNEQVARIRFEQGRSLGIGVCLDVYCRLGTALCCSTWFVEDLEESGRRLCSGLKLCVPAPGDLVVARPVRNGFIWRLRSWVDTRSGFDRFKNFLPLRCEPLKSLEIADTR